MSTFITALGWTGAVVCLTAYVLVTRGRWAPTSGRYQLANVVSGVMMGTVAASSGVWPSVFTNLVWAAVALHAVTVVLRARRARRARRVVETAMLEVPVELAA
ncbi:hypothetical protein KIN34_04970 [Cellulomonas sp. DKR-3]|uniref:CBU-0592-like domain-containing protein n=1 Tax=Cellulomonas fulva TaxID=2835530 RepID=A0ABS5TX13_9CELL|nr:hypothetical protein [Cellulomonas fulva]MBT0993637.1 hypothetical protein [Cellulomonas fulva]